MTEAKKFYRYSIGELMITFVTLKWFTVYCNSDVGIAVGNNRFNYVRYTGSFHIIQELEPDNDYAGFIFGYQDNR